MKPNQSAPVEKAFKQQKTQSAYEVLTGKKPKVPNYGHLKHVCAFRVSDAERKQLLKALAAVNAKANKSYTMADLYRAGVLALGHECAGSKPDWSGIIGDIEATL